MSNSGLFVRLYDPLMELPESLGLGRLRRDILRDVRGRVLELGIGTGRNIPLYSTEVDYLVGVDPDQSMLDQAEERARKAALPVDLTLARAEELPFEDGRFDAVVATLAFCTIPDPPQALREVRRVLKEGSDFRLLEHVRMKQRPIAWAQEKATPLWKHVASGCHLDRATLSVVREAGFDVERVERHLDGLVLGLFVRS